MLWIHVTVFLVICFAISKGDKKGPVVITKKGKIRGRCGKTIDKGRTYHAFQGIPFAEPPIGNLRFKEPVEKSKWKGTIHATRDKSQCVQYYADKGIEGEEDCLYINVYTPNHKARRLPVMVYIYGGGFTTGNSTFAAYGPDYLLNEGVVVVMFNYRLDVFGYISTEDDVAPGNVAIRDQILALQWVKANIGYFGGDPKKVTVFGISAGAASVSYLLQIQLAQGLFRAAIMQSGTSLCLWALNRRARLTAFKIGDHLGISTNDSQVLIDELRKVDYKTLQNASNAVSAAILYEYNSFSGLAFGPVKEKAGNNSLFSADSEEELSQGKFSRVPVIIGFTSNEAGVLEAYPDSLQPVFESYNNDKTQVTPADLTKDKTKISLAAGLINLRYFNTDRAEANDSSSAYSMSKFVTDDQFIKPIRKTVKDMSKYVPVYFYKFSYEGALGGANRNRVKGVFHGEDGGYIFQRYNILPANDNDILTRSRVVKMWTNFAKYGNPTPYQQRLLENITWPATVAEKDRYLPYLDIDRTLEIKLNPFVKRMIFWRDLYVKFGDPPYDTY